jgi:hypothetical protein
MLATTLSTLLLQSMKFVFGKIRPFGSFAALGCCDNFVLRYSHKSTLRFIKGLIYRATTPVRAKNLCKELCKFHDKSGKRRIRIAFF